MYLLVSYKKRKKFFFAFLKSLKKGVGSELDLDPDLFVRGEDPVPHQNVSDPQHLLEKMLSNEMNRLKVNPT
jgi:hypothetical protein